MCFRGGGGQRSTVKDHIFTFFLGPFPKCIAMILHFSLCYYGWGEDLILKTKITSYHKLFCHHFFVRLFHIFFSLVYQALYVQCTYIQYILCTLQRKLVSLQPSSRVLFCFVLISAFKYLRCQIQSLGALFGDSIQTRSQLIVQILFAAMGSADGLYSLGLDNAGGGGSVSWPSQIWFGQGWGVRRQYKLCLDRTGASVTSSHSLISGSVLGDILFVWCRVCRYCSWYLLSSFSISSTSQEKTMRPLQ